MLPMRYLQKSAYVRQHPLRDRLLLCCRLIDVHMSLSFWNSEVYEGQKQVQKDAAKSLLVPLDIGGMIKLQTVADWEMLRSFLFE